MGGRLQGDGHDNLKTQNHKKEKIATGALEYRYQWIGERKDEEMD